MHVDLGVLLDLVLGSWSYDVNPPRVVWFLGRVLVRLSSLHVLLFREEYSRGVMGSQDGPPDDYVDLGFDCPFEYDISRDELSRVWTVSERIPV